MNGLFDSSICIGGGPPQTAWTTSPAIVLPLIAIAALYAGGAGRLWHRSRRGIAARRLHALLFAAGWLALAAALVTPLHALSERLFSAHMVEHEIIMAVAAPLLAASAPLAALLWGLPRRWRRGLGRIGRAKLLVRFWRVVSRPAVATTLHGLAIWIWHVPGLFEAALERGVLHYLQHASFFGTALLFWWVMLPRRGREQRLGGSVMHLFLTSLHTGLLGVLLLISPRLWYPANAGLSDLFGLTPLQDQQLAGLIMWVPAGLIYAGAALFIVGLWIRNSGRPGEGSYALRVS